MDCCGHEHALTPRHLMWSSALISVGAMLSGGVGPQGSTAAARAAETASAALDVLRKSISVDVHTHGGKTGVTSKAPPNDDLANAMRAGSLAVACLADVPDGPVLGRNADGVLAAVRPPEPGQLYRHHLERLAWMDEMVANHGLRRALSAADLEAAHKAGEPAVIADVEGLDFLETKLERLEEAHQRGIRHVPGRIYGVDNSPIVCVEGSTDGLRRRRLVGADLDHVLRADIANEGKEQRLSYGRDQRPLDHLIRGEKGCAWLERRRIEDVRNRIGNSKIHNGECFRQAHRGMRPCSATTANQNSF